MIETSWVRSLSLVAASFTLSHVISIVLKADTADGVNLSSICGSMIPVVVLHSISQPRLDAQWGRMGRSWLLLLLLLKLAA